MITFIIIPFFFQFSVAFNAVIAYNEVMQSPETETSMATLTIRNVDAGLKERLRLRAARHGRSMEAELRHILSDTLGGETSRELNLAEAVRRRFLALGGADELMPHPPVPVGKPPALKR